MEKTLSTLIACVSIAASSLSLAAQAGPLREADILKPPVGVAVKEGIEAGGTCVGLIFEGPKYETCVISAQQLKAKNRGDHRLYDLGLYFDTWYTMDTLARPDEVPTLDVLKQAAGSAKPVAARYFALYKEAQKKVDVTDDQLITLYQLNEPQLLKARISAEAREVGR